MPVGETECQINPFSANTTKQSNTLKQFANSPRIVFDRLAGLALKGLRGHIYDSRHDEAEKIGKIIIQKLFYNTPLIF